MCPSVCRYIGHVKIWLAFALISQTTARSAMFVQNECVVICTNHNVFALFNPAQEHNAQTCSKKKSPCGIETMTCCSLEAMAIRCVALTSSHNYNAIAYNRWMEMAHDYCGAVQFQPICNTKCERCNAWTTCDHEDVNLSHFLLFRVKCSKSKCGIRNFAVSTCSVSLNAVEAARVCSEHYISMITVWMPHDAVAIRFQFSVCCLC